jgi:hypothetical protein
MGSWTKGSLAVLIAMTMIVPLGMRALPPAAADGKQGHIWLDCDPGMRAREGGWQAGGVVCLPGPYAPDGVLDFDLIVMNRAKVDLANLQVFLAIHGPGLTGTINSHPEFETTSDDMASVSVESQTFVLGDFSNTTVNPFDDAFGGLHLVYVGDDAIWTAFHYTGVLHPDETLRLHVSVALGPDPSPLFEIHFDAWDADTDEKTPNGHDVTLISAGSGGSQPPGACFLPMAGAMVNEGDLVTLNASCTSDPNADIISYEWDFDINVDSSGDGIPDNDVDATGEVVTFTWYDDYVSTVQLTVTDSDGNVDITYQTITVNNVAPIGAFERASMEVQLCLRLAGSKWSNVEVKVWENYDNTTGFGTRLVGDIEMERWPGSPDENPTTTGTNCLPLLLDVSRTYNYTAVVTYDPFPDNGDAIRGDQPNNGNDKDNNAGNPVWLICQFADGTICKFHHTFNTQQSMIRDSNQWNHVEPWLVPLNFGAVVGAPIDFAASAVDPGSDDLTFAWDWGDNTTSSATYLYDAIRGNDPAFPPGSPYEPYPPPLGLNDPAPPVFIIDSQTHTYATNGTYSVTLTITDDDGGIWTYHADVTVGETFCK